jgi:hypothetical protein
MYFCAEAPGKIWGQSIGALGPRGGGLTGIPAAPAVLPAGQGHREESMLTKGPLALRTWAGRHPTAAHSGDRRGRPRWPQLGRVQRTGSTTREARGTRRFYGRRPNDLVARTAQTCARWRRRPCRAAQQGWGGSAWHAQERAATLNRRSVVTAC